MATNQNIASFYRVATTKKFSRDFQLRINDFNVAGGGSIFGEDDLVYIKTISLPSRKIENIKAPYMGVNFNVPGAATYPGSDSWSVTFYADQALELRQRLEAAMSATFSPFTSQGDITLPGLENTIELHLLGDQLETLSVYRLYGAYITEIGAIDYKLTGSGSIQEIKATLAYQYWASEVDANNVNVKQTGFTGLLNKLSNTARGLSRTIRTIKEI